MIPESEYKNIKAFKRVDGNKLQPLPWMKEPNKDDFYKHINNIKGEDVAYVDWAGLNAEAWYNYREAIKAYQEHLAACAATPVPLVGIEEPKALHYAINDKAGYERDLAAYRAFMNKETYVVGVDVELTTRQIKKYPVQYEWVVIPIVPKETIKTKEI